MNRIILIGNGFDRAHELETSYKHFIDSFWEDLALKIKNNKGLCYEDEYIYLERCPNPFYYNKKNPDYQDLQDNLIRIGINIRYKNSFLKVITNQTYPPNKTYLQKWVDIEEEYYKELNKCLETNSKKDAIDKLNEDFLAVKNALENYLKKVIDEATNKCNVDILNKIYSIFDFKDFTKKGVDDIIEKEYEKFCQLKNDDKKLTVMDLSETTLQKLLFFNDTSFELTLPKFKKFILEENNHYNSFLLFPKQILFLNFNYSNTESLYCKDDYFKNNTTGFRKEIKIEKDTIHIHGELKNKQNPIIFGYGDEIANEYKAIEKKGGQFLENIKSIRYLETDNYKRLSSFIDSDNYQIFIMGHSCGLSDKTLLNTLFEHENCVSIKVFYHQKTEIKDNFSDVVRNISRNFNKKAVMREKVVNKQYCEPLLEYSGTELELSNTCQNIVSPLINKPSKSLFEQLQNF